jgi:O-antigen ligase
LKPALRAGASFSIAALLLVGAIDSLSRMGFLCALFSLAVLGAAALPRKRWLLALPAAVFLLLIYLPPDQLIDRFAQISTADQIASQDRVAVWRETLPLIAAYPAAGCGLGAFESVFVRFKHHAPTIVDNYAHNDYLQYLAEVGTFGFALGLALVGGLLFTAARASLRHASAADRALARASLASMAALLLHSTVDFNSYIPANAFAFAWIAALAASAMFSSRPVPAFGTEEVLELKAKR